MTFIRPLIVALAAALAMPVAAQDAVSLRSDVHVVRVVDGEERRDPPASVVPGDRLVFTTSFQNESGAAVENFVVTNPLPAPVVLAQDGQFAVSVDGGASFGPLGEQRVVDNDEPRAATVADVTHVRWTVASIAPGAGGELSYFATVR